MQHLRLKIKNPDKLSLKLTGLSFYCCLLRGRVVYGHKLLPCPRGGVQTPQSLRDSPPSLARGAAYGINERESYKAPPLSEGQLRPNRKQLGSKATGALEGCPEGTEGREFPYRKGVPKGRRGMVIAQKYTGPCPMQDVVLMAVRAAVSTDIASWITDFQKSLFFIAFLYVLFFGAKKEPKKHSPLPNHPPRDGLIDFGLTPFIKFFWYRSQACALRASDNIYTRFARFFFAQKVRLINLRLAPQSSSPARGEVSRRDGGV